MPRVYERIDPFHRLMEKVKIGREDGCWIYEGKAKKNGYSCVNSGGRSGLILYGHIVVYERFNGPVPKGIRLHHTCETPLCVNPGHLTEQTAKTHANEHGLGIGPCKKCGEEDWYMRKDTGSRQCRNCKRNRRNAC